jgi:hypothetical protein
MSNSICILLTEDESSELWWTPLYETRSIEQQRAPSSRRPQDSDARIYTLNAGIVGALPSGFNRLSATRLLSHEMIVLLKRIACYHTKSSKGFADELVTERLAQRFSDRCPALLDQRPTFEKFLSWTLLVYCSVVFSPKPDLLEASVMLMAPRRLLTRDLNSLEVETKEEVDCVMWMRMVLICAWSLRGGGQSASAITTQLSQQLVEEDPQLVAWCEVERVLGDFFATQLLKDTLRRHWVEVVGVGS